MFVEGLTLKTELGLPLVSALAVCSQRPCPACSEDRLAEATACLTAAGWREVWPAELEAAHSPETVFVL